MMRMPFTTIELLLCVLCMSLGSMTLSAQNIDIDWEVRVDSCNIFSSPRAVHLNSDDVLDIVIGGGEELVARTQSVTAIDGATGDILWQVGARDEIFGSAIFQDVTGDGISEVFIGGRGAEFMAINGATGDVVWEYYPEGDNTNPADVGLYNFYNAQFIPDEDGDGYMDLLLGNGGDKSASNTDTIRPPGFLMVVNAANGDLIAQAEVPDGKEVYMSPYALDFEGDGIMEVIFGTGGYVAHGSLWRTTLLDVLNEDISEAELILSGVDHSGMVAPPAFVDINGDDKLDIIIDAFSEKIAAIDGITNEIIWEVILDNNPNTESLTTPAIGRFNDDFVPDVFTINAVGLAGAYLSFHALMIDGATGEILWTDTLSGWSIVSPVAFDHDLDGYDEVVYQTNTSFFDGAPYKNQLRYIDFNNNKNHAFFPEQPGLNLAATPLVRDLDNDGQLDMVYVHQTDSTQINAGKGMSIKKLDLNTTAPENVAWGAYQGNAYDGKFVNHLEECIGNFDINFTTTPTCFGESGSLVGQVATGNAPYQWSFNEGNWSSSTFSTNFAFQSLPVGNYSLSIRDDEGCSQTLNVSFLESEAIDIAIATDEPSNANATDGAIDLTTTGGTTPLSYLWSNGSMATNLTNVGSGLYTVTITDNVDCEITETILLAVTGIDEADLKQQVKIFPNPNRGVFSIKNKTNTSIQLRIFDESGRFLNTQTLEKGRQSVDVSDYGTGVFFLEMSNKQGKWMEKVLVLEK